MSTQFKIQYQGTTYNYTSNISNKTVDSVSYTAKTISRKEIFFELDRQSCTIMVDASVVPFSLIKDRRHQTPMIIDLIDDSGDVFMTAEVSSADIVTANNQMTVKLDAMRKLERAEIPNRSITPNCTFSLYDGSATKACPAAASSHKISFTSSVPILFSIDSTDKRKLNYAVGGLTVNIFQLGHAVFSDGSGNELARYYIVSNLANSISFLNSIDINISDVSTIDFYKGCNKRLITSGDCSATFNVNEHFGGFPLAFNHGGEKAKDFFIPIVYGSQVHVDAKIIYALDKALVPIFSEGYPFDDGAYGHFQSFGLGLARKADSLHQIYYINDRKDKCLVTPNGMAALTTGQSTNEAILCGSTSQVKLPKDKNVSIFGLTTNINKNGYVGVLSENKMTFYDGNQSSADAYYTAYAPTTGNINEMYYKDVAKVDFGFNGIAKLLNDVSNTASLARLKNYNGATHYANATQAFIGIIPELDFQDLGQESFELPDLRAVVSYSPTLAGSTTSATIGTSGNQGANPANVVYDLLVNYLNISSSDIDTTSFTNARNTLAGETTPLGINMAIDKPTNVKKIIDNVCAFAGMILSRGTTGSTGTTFKWTLKVLRFTDTATASVYPAGNQFNESNTSNVKLKFNGPDRIYSDVKIEYFEPTHQNKTTYVFANEVARNMIGGVKSKKVSFGDCVIYSREVLKAIMSREVSKLTRPLNQITFKYFQAPNNERLIFVGDIIYYKNAQYGISDYKTFRVLEVSGLREANHERTIKAIELWDENAFIDIPDDWIVPDELVAGSAGDKLIIPAAQEMTFPLPAITGAIGNTSTDAAYGSDIWSLKPWDKSFQKKGFANFDCAMVGSVTSGFSKSLFLDNTGDLKFTLDSGAGDYLKNTDIGEDEFWEKGGLFAIVGESNEYEFLSIRKITESGGTYTCHDVIRNYFGGWNLANPLFGTEDHGYTSGMKIYIYGDTGSGSSGRMRDTYVAGQLVAGEDIGLTTGDRYLQTKNKYKYLLGATPTAAATNSTKIQNFTGTTLGNDKQSCIFPYPITDGVVSPTTDLDNSVAVVFSPTFPNAPKGCNLKNVVKSSGWGFAGDYTRGVDIPDYLVYINQAGQDSEYAIIRYGDFKYGLTSKAVLGYNGFQAASLYAIKNGTGDDLYKEGYLRLTIQTDTNVFSDANSITIHSFWNGVYSEGVTFSFP